MVVSCFCLPSIHPLFSGDQVSLCFWENPLLAVSVLFLRPPGLTQGQTPDLIQGKEIQPREFSSKQSERGFLSTGVANELTSKEEELRVGEQRKRLIKRQVPWALGSD